MNKALREELTAFFRFAREYRVEIAVTVSAAVFFTLYWYHPVVGNTVSYFVYFALGPFAVIKLVLRERLASFGVRRGNLRRGLLHVLYGGIFLVLPVQIYFSMLDPSIREFYSDAGFSVPVYLFRTTLQLWCWEFILRGYLLFGLAKKFGRGAILLQMLPFTLLHFQKPLIEVLGCTFWGIYLGFAAFRARSMWPAFILHWIANVLSTMLVNCF